MGILLSGTADAANAGTSPMNTVAYIVVWIVAIVANVIFPFCVLPL